jgi:hypothetical protein
MCDFAANQDQWYPTWPTNVEERAMVVYVFSDPCYVVCGADLSDSFQNLAIGIMSRCGNIVETFISLSRLLLDFSTHGLDTLK